MTYRLSAANAMQWCMIQLKKYGDHVFGMNTTGWVGPVDWLDKCTLYQFYFHFMTSFCDHLTYIETLWKLVKWKCFVPDTPSFVTIYGLMWSSSVTFKHRWCWRTPMCHWLRDITLSGNDLTTFYDKFQSDVNWRNLIILFHVLQSIL